MKKVERFLFLICFIFLINGCTSKTNNVLESSPVEYGEIMAAFQNGNEVNYYKIEDGNLSSIDFKDNVAEFQYNLNSKVYVYLINIKKGNNLTNNKIEVQKNNEKFYIDKYYFNSGVKISPNSSKIAFTAYSKDSLESIEGLKIYDIKNNKEINLNSNILISGDLYNWISDEKIIYYGTNPNKKIYNNICVYNTKDKTEKVYMDKVEGFCTSLIPLESNLLYIEQQYDDSKLAFYNSENNTKKIINNNLEKIYDWAFNSKTGEVFFIGKEKNTDKNALYEFSLNYKNLNKLNYDFPENVDENGGISIDKSGNVYFCGYNSEDFNSKDIYMYNNKEKSNNLISIESGHYYVFGNKKI
ncbi:hypothetical protein CLOACE_01750 [Clostridium acetireducens DSM 10703]|uniref:Uncharacterized protein n=1 Tax=Clostridium acetireducens DSM 10703 TaxID=1121290 RepID=A0A1E8F1Q1_9CLOT|nr:DPP IV N-terminal domain-containing protein [Clostridium acetireducens]OFI07571.1 hypothetical protein CLOACE_01750 [Clostridium acetireducens DSM 10703]